MAKIESASMAGDSTQVREAHSPPAGSSARAWWMLVHQLPPQPPGLRMRVWRRLLALGALQVKGSVYLLPATEAAREDLQWLLGEIRAANGEATLWRAQSIDGLDDDDLVLRFQALVALEYDALQAEARKLHDARSRKRKPLSADETARQLSRLRARFNEIAGRDHFHAPRREVVGALLAGLEPDSRKAGAGAQATAAGRLDPHAYRGRTWVTRARVHVDRMASAWLIRRFIDPQAVFKFVDAARRAPEGTGLRFDMYGGEFTHEGELCTFEVLLKRFGLGAPGLRSIAQIVHDIDLKESRYGLPETLGVAASLDAIAEAASDDEARLSLSGTVFDGLLARFARRAD
jgi:hypothetical protein